MLLENAVKIKNETQKTYEGLNDIVLHNYNVSKPTTVVGCMSLVSNLKLFKVYLGIAQPQLPKVGDIWIKADSLLLDNIKVNIVSDVQDNDFAVTEANSLGILISNEFNKATTLLNLPIFSLSLPIKEAYLFDKNAKQIIDVQIAIYSNMSNNFEVLTTRELPPIYASRLMLSQIYDNIGKIQYVSYLTMTENLTYLKNMPVNKFSENADISAIYNDVANIPYVSYLTLNETISASKNKVPIPIG